MTIRNSWKRVIAGTLAVLVVAGTVPGNLGINWLFSGNSTSITAYAAGATTLTAETTTWESGDYVVPEGGLTISGHITVNGTVNLTLPAGTTLTANMGITLSDGATINVSGEGAMVVKGSNGNANSTVAGTGTLVLKSGTVTVTGGNGGDNRGVSVSTNPGGAAINGAVTVNGGTLTATGGRGGNLGERSAYSTTGAGGAAIGGSVTINAGTVTATGGNGGTIGEMSMGATTGAGGAGIAEAVTINGGKLTTTNGTGGGGQNDGTRGAGGKAVSGTVTCGEGVTQSGDTYEGPDISQGPDKTALNDAITAAETLYNSIKDNTDYADIASTFHTAINTAKGVAESGEVDQDAVDTATSDIITANTTAVIGIINALPSASDVTTADREVIETVREAYDALDAAQKALVDADTLKKLTDAEAALATIDQTVAGNVTTTIGNLPAATDVTTENRAAIKAAREAYDALDETQKKLVDADTLKKLTDAEAALATIDQTAAGNVTTTIGNLPAATDVTTENREAIKAAREAYDALDETQKKLVDADTLQKLTDVEAALATIDQTAVSNVTTTIGNLPAATEVTAANREAIEAAREAYDALDETQKKLVDADTLKKLTDAEDALSTIDQAAAGNVNTTIGNLPAATDVTVDSREAIEAAREAYDALDEAQKKLVDEDTLKKLTDTEKALKDAEIAKSATDVINALPASDKVATTDKAAIEAARKAYDALTADQKKRVSADTLKKLTDAETALTAAEKKATDEAAAKAVTDKINVLPSSDKVATTDKEAIEAARKAYNALTADQKKLVDAATLKKLTDAETALTAAENKKDEAPGNNYSSEWVDGLWYDADGSQNYDSKASWKTNGTGWWFETESGWYPVATWQKIDGKWYYFDAEGYMASNEWVDGYWLSGNGAWEYQYIGSWKTNGSGWWFEDESGWYPSSQWQRIDGKWYYFGSDGIMATDQYIGEYWVGSDGSWQ